MEPNQTTIGEAKTHFSKLIHQVEAGAEVIVKRGSKPVAKIVPYEEPKPRKPIPWGKYAMDFKGVDAVKFLEPTSEEELAEWENSPIDPQP